ncbi:hypothetical protein [Actinoplanes sp. NPDC049265]|uniref:hypothetical protein n=1 Tax=Actinoplanes sp. NPDC049265 TaxID=3363902 RepID=UPI0037235740
MRAPRHRGVTHPDPVSAARAVAAETIQAFADAFGDRLAAGYLLGSLAYGGYAPAVSDIDVAVVLTDRQPGDPDLVDATVGALRERSPLHAKLSVFWSSLPALRAGESDGRFPGIDRMQLVDDGVLLAGTDVTGQVGRIPGRDLMLESIRFAVELLATDEVIAEFHRPRRLLVDPVWFTKAVFFPLRIRFSAEGGAGTSSKNDDALMWYLVNRSQPPGGDLVRMANRIRGGEPLDPEEAAISLAAGLVPLYRRFLDDHLYHLRRVDAPPELIAAVERWNERLADPGPD